MSIKEEVGERIRTTRTKQKISRKELADAVGLTGSCIANYENAIREPELETIQKIAKYLGVRIEYIICGIEGEKNMQTAAGKDFNKTNREVHADIADVFGEVFRDNMAMSQTERSVLQDFYSLYADEVLLGTDNGYDYRLAGILDFLRSCRKIDEEADEQLSMLMNRIEKEKYA